MHFQPHFSRPVDIDSAPSVAQGLCLISNQLLYVVFILHCWTENVKEVPPVVL